MNFSKMHCAIPALLVAALSASPALGQEADADGQTARADDEIVVTAQRRSQAISDVPLSVQAFSGETLEETGIRDLSQIISLVPGASEGRGNAAGIRSYQIRGVSSFYGDSTVGYYLDEAAYVIPNRNYAPVARTFDIDRVEVLRGPQGTLYGLGSMGGTIRFITADPDLERLRVRGAAGYSSTEGGDDNHYTDLAVSVPIIQNVLAVRAVASQEILGGYAQSPSFPGDLNDGDIQNYRFRVLATPTEDLTMRFGYHRSDIQDDWGRNLATTDPAAFPASPVPGRNQQVFDMYTAYVGYDFDSFSLESSTGYVDREDRASGPIVLGPGPSFRLDVIGDSTSFVQEVRAVSQGDTPLQWVIGGIYQESENLEDIVVIGGPPISAVSIYNSESHAIFGEVSYGFLGGRLRPLIGLRYFEDSRTFFTQSRAPFLAPPYTDEETFSSLSPRFNVSFEIDEDHLVYLNVARGYRSGTFNTAAAVAASGGTVPFTVDPDDIWSYEIGGKFHLSDELYVEAALYYYDWADVQLNYSIGAGVQVIRNAGDVEGQGIDLSMTWRPIEGLTLQAAANLNATEFATIINPAAFAATPHIAEGNQLASVPESTYSFDATYTHPLGGDFELFLNAGYTFISEQGDPGDDPPGPPTAAARMGDEHELLRARVGVERGPIGVYLFGDNLLDDSGPIQVSGSGRSRYYPRVVGVELAWDF